MFINEGSCNGCVYSATKCELKQHLPGQAREPGGLVLDFYMILNVFSLITITEFHYGKEIEA